MLGVIGDWAIVLIALAAIIGILIVACRAAGLNPPSWVIQIGWIVVVALVAIAGVKLVLRFA